MKKYSFALLFLLIPISSFCMDEQKPRTSNKYPIRPVIRMTLTSHGNWQQFYQGLANSYAAIVQENGPAQEQPVFDYTYYNAEHTTPDCNPQKNHTILIIKEPTSRPLTVTAERVCAIFKANGLIIIKAEVAKHKK